MPVPAVIVELPAGGDRAALAPVLLEACSAHLVAPGGCALADEASLVDPGEAKAIAIVSWSVGDARGGPATAHLQVGIRKGPSAAWAARDLPFKPEDAVAERWRAVGLAIASLVGERAPNDTAPAPQDTRTPTADQEPSNSPVARGATTSALEGPRARPSFWFDGGFVVGPLGGAAAFGGTLRGFHRLGQAPLLVVATAAYTLATVSDAPAIELARLDLGVGVAMAVAFAGDGLVEAHLQAVASRLAASGSDPARGDASGSTFTVGALVGASVGWFFLGPLGVFLGADATARSAGADVKGGDADLARASPLGWNAVAGVRLALD